MGRKKGNKRAGFGYRLAAALLCVVLLMASGACAAGAAAAGDTTGKETADNAAADKETAGKDTAGKDTAGKNTAGVVWKAKKDYWYCYGNKNKVQKGFVRIGKNWYLFDRKGRQKTGWQKVGGKFRYFRIVNGSGGYMVTGQKVNGVTINRKGYAKVTAGVKKKLETMVRFQALAEKLTRPGMRPKKKLVTVFKYARDKRYRSIGAPPAESGWDVKYAAAFLDSGFADCIMAACGFAYLANAVGYEDIVVKMFEGHCHCEIDQLIYDPGFAKTVSDSQYTRYFGRTYKELPAWHTGKEVAAREI